MGVDKEQVIIGLGTGRCGTQTFAKMFDIPHQMYEGFPEGSDVHPKHIGVVEEIDNQYNAKFVCLKRNMEDTVDSLVINTSLNEDEAVAFYNNYYEMAEYYEERMDNFRIFDTQELNHPQNIENFLGVKSTEVEPIVGVCNWCKSI